jgi:hypothetical protein
MLALQCLCRLHEYHPSGISEAGAAIRLRNARLKKPVEAAAPMNINDTDSAGNEDVENNATTSSEKATPGRVSKNTQSHFGTEQTKIKDALTGSAGARRLVSYNGRSR